MITRPMLAATWVEGTELRYPLVTSPKLDGIRVLCHPELGPVTRKFKPLPNNATWEVLLSPGFYGFDGELMLGDGGNFNKVQSAFMSQQGAPDFVFYVFDNFTHPEDPWDMRHDSIQPQDERVIRLEHTVVDCWEKITLQEDLALHLSFEGLMLRDEQATYKSGRSTLREQGLIKLKRFKDAEGALVRMEEQMHNANTKETDELGLSKRSSHKNNMQPANTLGKIIVETALWGEVTIGTGFTAAQRQHMWDNPLDYIGCIATFKYQEVLKDKPRFPVFLGWRKD